MQRTGRRRRLAILALALATLFVSPAASLAQDATILVSPPDWAPAPTAELARQPTTSEMRKSYPRAARRARIDAMVVFHCTVNADQTLACPRVAVSDFLGRPLPIADNMRHAFTTAGRKVQEKLRAKPTLSNGAPSAGHPLMVVLYFRHDL